jgi:hypothetical protein
MDEFENFNEEIDPVQKAELESLYQAEIEKSMREAYDFIENKMGWDNWISDRNRSVSKDRRVRILTNMMNWFAGPNIEEYEKAAKIKRTLDKISI